MNYNFDSIALVKWSNNKYGVRTRNYGSYYFWEKRFLSSPFPWGEDSNNITKYCHMSKTKAEKLYNQLIKLKSNNDKNNYEVINEKNNWGN